jgi:hypothetical protein
VVPVAVAVVVVVVGHGHEHTKRKQARHCAPSMWEVFGETFGTNAPA